MRGEDLAFAAGAFTLIFGFIALCLGICVVASWIVGWWRRRRPLPPLDRMVLAERVVQLRAVEDGKVRRCEWCPDGCGPAVPFHTASGRVFQVGAGCLRAMLADREGEAVPPGGAA